MNESDEARREEADRLARRMNADLLIAHSKYMHRAVGVGGKEQLDLFRDYLLERFDAFASGLWNIIPCHDGEKSYEQLLTSALADHVGPLLRRAGVELDDPKWARDVAVLLEARKNWYLGHAIKARVEAEGQQRVAIIAKKSGDGKKPGAARTDPLFPARAAWLNDRLRERSWNKHDPYHRGGPDHKTVQKILDGKRVREDVLEKLVNALSKVPDSKKLPKLSLLDIPQC